MIPDDFSERAKEILREQVMKARQIKVHSIVLLWISPFGELSHRCGFFEDFDEATRFANYLDESCKKANGDDVKCSVYMDGFLYK